MFLVCSSKIASTVRFLSLSRQWSFQPPVNPPLSITASLRPQLLHDAFPFTDPLSGVSQSRQALYNSNQSEL